MSADLFAAFGNTPSARKDNAALASSKQDFLFQTSSSPQLKQPREPVASHDEPLWKATPGGNDVLFDAADEELQDDEDEDFGDFEDANLADRTEPQPASQSMLQVSTKYQPSDGLIDLLSLEESPAESTAPGAEAFEPPQSTKPHTQPPSEPTKPPQDTLLDDGWGDFEAPGVSGISEPMANAKPSGTDLGIQPRSEDIDFETAWDEFQDGTVEQKPSVAPRSQPSKAVAERISPAQPTPALEAEAEADNWDDFVDQPAKKPASKPPTQSTSAIPPNAARPTNVPPPSTLLPWLVLIYSTLPTPAPSSPTILQLHRLSARILAGRAHRWRRDTLLSQSLRISDMTSGARQSGMKLSSLSKSETQREAREAAETVSGWNALVPTFTTALRKQNVVLPKGTKLRLTGPLAVKVLKSEQGGMDASYICPVCGLKRNERVVGVDDVAVEDVFGEFWREGWGHKECAEGWYGYTELLKQR